MSCRTRSTAVVFVLLVFGPEWNSRLAAQVFAPAPGASQGEITAGQGQALHGSFGRNAAQGGAYSNYRKFHDSAVELQSATNDAGNPSSMTWMGLNQSNATLAPGMFMPTGYV